MSGVPRVGSGRGLIVFAVGMLLVAAVFAGSGSSHSAVTVKPNSLAFFDAGAGELTADVALPGPPLRCVVRSGTTWVIAYGGRTVYRVGTRRHRLLGTVKLGFAPSGVAADSGAVWARGENALVRIDPSSARVVGSIAAPPSAGRSVGTFYSSVASDQGSVWIANRLEILRIDPRTKKVQADNRKIAGYPTALAGGLGAMWVVDMGGLLYRLDPLSAAVLKQTTINLANAERPAAVAVGADGVWVTDASGNKVWKVDATGTVSGTVGVGRDPVAVAPAGGSIWVAAQNDDTLTQIDPSDATRVGTVAISRTPVALCGDATQLVVAVQ